MEPVRAAWRRWLSSPVRDVVSALVVTAVLISGTYGEAHPSSPSDTIQFRGRLVPHPPPAAYLLVAIACLVLAGRRRWPVSVLTVSTAAVAGFTLLGYMNGCASPASGMTWSRTPWLPSTCRPARPPTSCPPARRLLPRPCRQSRRPARRGSGSCARSSTCCARPTTPTPPSLHRAPRSSRPSSPGPATPPSRPRAP